RRAAYAALAHSLRAAIWRHPLCDPPIDRRRVSVQLGFFTACLPGLSLEEIAGWAAEHRFDALEVAAWPDLGGRPFTATHIDVADLTDGDAEGVGGVFDRHGLTLSSLAFYDNNLDP